MATFATKPVAIEAVRWTGDNFAEVAAFAGDDVRRTVEDGDRFYHGPASLMVRTWSGEKLATMGDWIVRDASGEFRPCDPCQFVARHVAASAQERGR